MGYTEYDRWEFYSVLISDTERESFRLSGEGELHIMFFFYFFPFLPSGKEWWIEVFLTYV